MSVSTPNCMFCFLFAVFDLFRILQETVAPILSIGNASLVAISTLTSEISKFQIISFECLALCIQILT